MENKEYIDRLYQEKFKDFEVAPHPKVWKNIEASLQKKKRRILPFWWISGGAVATLLIGLLLFSIPSKKPPTELNLEETITETEKTPLPEAVEELKNEKNNINTTIVITKIPTQKTIENSLKTESSNKKSNEETRKFSNVKKVIVAEKIIEKNQIITKNKPSENKIIDKTIRTIAKKRKKGVNKKVEKKSILEKTENLVAVNENTEEKTNKNIQKKWSVTPSIALLNAGTFNNVSPISENLNNNSISGENTYSYGVKVGYKINKKWELQTGVHLQKMHYNTPNVSLVNASTSENSTINFEANQFSLESENTLLNDFSATSGESNEVIVSRATLNQTYGYIEIPIEIKYTFFKSPRFSTQLVTGFSSLFLNSNKVSVTATNFSQTLGRATNLNSLNFSGNFGFNINYKLLKKLQLTVNPMFKQQFNTFSKKANGFKPYSIGIYTGIKYEF